MFKYLLIAAMLVLVIVLGCEFVSVWRIDLGMDGREKVLYISLLVVCGILYSQRETPEQQERKFM